MVKAENLCMDNFDETLNRKSLGKIAKPGPTRVYRNPFINFMLDFRRNVKVKGKELMSKAAEQWRNMDEKEKAPYCDMARRAPKTRKKARKMYPKRKRR